MATILIVEKRQESVVKKLEKWTARPYYMGGKAETIHCLQLMPDLLSCHVAEYLLSHKMLAPTLSRMHKT